MYIFALITGIMLFSASVFGGVTSPLVLLSVLTVHEAGHFIAAKLVGADLIYFRGNIFGFRMKYDFSSISLTKEITVYLSGCIFGVISLIPFAFFDFNNRDGAEYFVTATLFLSVLNLLPVKGLDGGSIMSSVLDRLFLPEKSEKTMRIISTFFALLFWLLSMWIQLNVCANISMIFLSLYLLYISLF